MIEENKHTLPANSPPEWDHKSVACLYEDNRTLLSCKSKFKDRSLPFGGPPNIVLEKPND